MASLQNLNRKKINRSASQLSGSDQDSKSPLATRLQALSLLLQLNPNLQLLSTFMDGKQKKTEKVTASPATDA